MDLSLTVNPEANIGIDEIRTLLPHRYPFLMIDKVIDYKEGEWIKAIKNVSVNEPCFLGHFPVSPIFPGVLILEAMAQATGLLAFKTKELPPNEIYYFAAVDEAKFRRPVRPGDQILFVMELISEKRNLASFSGKAYVDGKVVCEARLKCARSSY